MLFNSLEFLIFFPFVVVVHLLLPKKGRLIFLLGSSYFFYMCWKAEYIGLILISTLVDYFVARGIHAGKSRLFRKALLSVSILVNLGLLGVFKYADFLGEMLRDLLGLFGMGMDGTDWGLLLPVGISFYTFQTLAYTIDVYKGKMEPEKNLGYFALYVAFFPQLVAGPIERPSNLIPRIRAPIGLTLSRLGSGGMLILFGFFKKVVIADRIAPYVDAIFANPDHHSGNAIALAIYFFAFQIYCDFSGYSDIARGCARILGMELMINFNFPYFARSIQEFWRRWHISLSTWFRDYLYTPLGGSSGSGYRIYFNIMVVFAVSGLWHGANYTFLIWGVFHGLGLIGYRIFKSITSKTRSPHSRLMGIVTSILSIIGTFHFVLLGWIFFRAESLYHALDLIKGLLRINLLELGINVAIGPYKILLAAAMISLLLIWESLMQFERSKGFLLKLRQPYKWAIAYAIGVAILCFGEFNQVEFIYFQF